jgi:NarL family two-component system response regulator LiaR
MIDAEPEFERAGEAGNGQDALRLIPLAAPDVVLMDLVMPQMDGIAAIEALRKQLPSTRFLILTSLVDPNEVQRAIKAGACGYLLKNASAMELVSVIRNAFGGRRVLAPEVTDALIAASQQPAPGGDLTQREREILALMTRGLNNQEIAAELAVAVPTVKFHITNVLSKLHVDNRTEAVLKALKHRLVPPV